MTVLDCIKTALARVGLNTTNTEFQTQARLYLNATLQQLSGEATWWWLHKTSTIQCTREFTLTSVTGTFAVASTVTGQTSGATATRASHDRCKGSSLSTEGLFERRRCTGHVTE